MRAGNGYARGTGVHPARLLSERGGLFQHEESAMNKDTIKGSIKESAGKVQKEFGKAVDSPKHVAEGGAKEVEGKTQKAAGHIKEAVKTFTK
jgi:uncharacterized protein YjbJ (UPF0337 family)